MFEQYAFHNVSAQCPVCVDHTMLFWVVGIIGFWAGCLMMTLLLRKPKVVYIEREVEEDEDGTE